MIAGTLLPYEQAASSTAALCVRLYLIIPNSQASAVALSVKMFSFSLNSTSF